LIQKTERSSAYDNLPIKCDMNQEVLTSRAAKSSAQIGLYAASFLANFMKRYLLAAQNKEQF
ncbi:hypothetical protein, partial [Escherichia coli]|uniref:hypothetical protein n=1 Tax=Escherichia coli TaxID=562 RepID=UPI003732DD1A